MSDLRTIIRRFGSQPAAHLGHLRLVESNHLKPERPEPGAGAIDREPASTSTAITSDQLTALMAASSSSASTISPPGSSLIKASTAEASSTASLIPSFGAPHLEQPLGQELTLRHLLAYHALCRAHRGPPALD